MMKKLHLLFILLLSSATTIFAQNVSVETKSVSISAGTVSVDVSISGFTSRSFSFRLNFDHTVLDNPTFSNEMNIPNTGFTVTQDNHTYVYFYWDRSPYVAVPLSDGVLFTVTFDIIGSVGDISPLIFSNLFGDPNAFTNTDGLITITAPLPVELTTFNAQPHQENILLDWSTATEENNAGFDIERSANGDNWETLDFVTGHGTTLEEQHYTYKDRQPLGGMSYYRLKQMDYDGAFEYSDVIAIETEEGLGKAAINIFPNPVVEHITIQNATGQAVLYNALGEPLRSLNLTNNLTKVSMTDLPSGAYILEVLQEDGRKEVKRIVKQ